jgi:glycosyltransferase 2 family protein
MKKGVSRVIRIAFTTLIVVMLVLFARTVNWKETWSAIRSASPGILVAAALVNLLSLTVKGVRWWIFLRPIGATSLGLALRATFAGAGLNNVLVANGGEAARVIFVARTAHIQSARVLATLAIERLFELIGYILLLVGAVSFLSLPREIARARPLAIAALVLIVAFLVFLVRRPASGELPEVDGHGMGARLKGFWNRFVHALAGISTGPRFAAALGLSVLGWALQVVTYSLTARAAHFDLSLVGTIAAIIAVNLGFALRATPGNVGVFQMLYAVAASAFGASKDDAIAVAFLIQTQQILPVTILGVLMAPEFLFRRRRTPRADNVLPGEPVLGGSD